jgi:hypothetical protein
LVGDEFDVDMFDENLDDDQHIDENDESSSTKSDEGNKSNMPHSTIALCDVLTSSRID